MSFLFGGGSKKVEPAPRETDVRAEEKRKIRRGAQRSTILTSAAGLAGEPMIRRKTLLGE